MNINNLLTFTLFSCLAINFYGVLAETCRPNACLNDGQCIQNGSQIHCKCPSTHFGPRCEKLSCDGISQNPCTNGGVCELTPGQSHRFKCHCPLGYDGYTCEVRLRTACDSKPCGEHGECSLAGSIEKHECKCHSGYTGTDCSQRDYCSDNPCLTHGQCVSLANGYQCKCDHGWQGGQCQQDVDECQHDPCEHGTCVNKPGYYYCECPNDFYGRNCNMKRVPSCVSNPCLNGGYCFDDHTQTDRDFYCACPAGFTGERCEVNIDDCDVDGINPCVNGGYCIDGINSYTCKCPPEFTGSNCHQDVDECKISGICQNGGTCMNHHGGYKCLCIAGFEGTNCETNKDDCVNNMCSQGSTCIDEIMAYRCECPPGRIGEYCTYPDPCYGKNNQCKHGRCIKNNLLGNYTCVCEDGWEGPNCNDDVNECDFGDDICNKGICYNTPGSFMCKCDVGWTGPTCMEDINECEPNPCKNGATCLNDVGLFICVCMPGYTGIYCETRVNITGDVHCTLPCENGGLCRNSSYCECPPPFTGPLCGQEKPSPCRHHNCTNGATCMPTSDFESFTCHCPPGHTGDQCEIKVSGCKENPCKNGVCKALEDDEYVCECEPGFNGAHCETNIDDCKDNPCLNDGFCIDGNNSFTCICPTDTTGALCETRIEKPCKNNFCQNGAQCVDLDNSYECKCKKGFKGRFCDIDNDECALNPCQNGGKCYDLINDFTCVCPFGFAGQRCELNVDECRNVTCKNGGTCVDGVNSFKCTCPRGYYGTYCEAWEDVDRFWRNDELDKSECQKFDCSKKANDGICHEECNKFACNFDGGDCALKNHDPFANCSAASYCSRVFGDKKCDQICDNEACLFDGFDCQNGNRCEIFDFCSQRYADGHCDPICNVANCGWDGGDCALAPQHHALLPGDLVLILLVDEPAFRGMINRFLLSLSWDLRSSIKLRLDGEGRPMIYKWHSTTGQGALVDVAGMNLTGFLGVTSETNEVHAPNMNHADNRNGIMVYLQVDVGICRESYSSFDCFTTVDSAAQYLSAASTKKDLDDLGVPLYSAYAYKPTPVEPTTSQNFIFSVVACFLVAFIAVAVITTSRKRRMHAHIFHPPQQTKDTDSFRGSTPYLHLQPGMRHPLIDGMSSNSDIFGDNKGYSTGASSVVASPSAKKPRKEVIDLTGPKFDPKLTPLHEQAGSMNCIQPNVVTKEDLYKRDARGRTPLHWTVDSHKDKTEEMIKRDIDLLMGAGAEVSAVDNDLRTPLHLALRRAREQVALRLIEYKAEILNVPDIDDRTPLYDAVCAKSPKVISAIFYFSNDEKMINHVVNVNDTALKACVSMTHEIGMPMLRLLLEHKANPNLAGDDKSPRFLGQTPLHIAASVNNYSFLRPLVMAGANKDSQDVQGRTPLFVAAENGHMESVMELLRLGASKDISDELSVAKEIAPDCAPRTPQLVAVERGFQELAKRIENFVHEPEIADTYDTRIPDRIRPVEDDMVPAKRPRKSPKTTKANKEKDIGALLTPPQSEKSSYSYTPSPQTGSGHMSGHPMTSAMGSHTNSTKSHSVESGHGVQMCASHSDCLITHSPDNGYGSSGWSPTEERALTSLDASAEVWKIPSSNQTAHNGGSPQTAFDSHPHDVGKSEPYFKNPLPAYEPNNLHLGLSATTSAAFDNPYASASIYQDPPTSRQPSTQAHQFQVDPVYGQSGAYFNPQFVGTNPMSMLYGSLRRNQSQNQQQLPSYNQYFSHLSS